MVSLISKDGKHYIGVNFKQCKEQLYLSRKTILFGKSRGIAIWDKQAMANHEQSEERKEGQLLLGYRRKWGGLF